MSTIGSAPTHGLHAGPRAGGTRRCAVRCAALLLLAGCTSAAPSATSGTPSHSPTTTSGVTASTPPAAAAGPVGAGASASPRRCPHGTAGPAPAVEQLTVSPAGIAELLTWRPTVDADCVEFTHGRAAPTVLEGGARSYLWNPVSLDGVFDLRRTTVAPEILLVSAYAQGRLVERFGAFLDCPSLVFVAARGSGQNGYSTEDFAKGLGDRAARVVAVLRRSLGRSERTLPAIAIDYPAIAVRPAAGQVAAGDYPSLYDDSVSQGTSAAVSQIVRAMRACPRSRFVLFGYSQGAQVMGDAYARLSGTSRRQVARLVLFADATWRGGDPRVLYRPAALPSDGRGIKGRRPLFPPSSTVIESWCWSQDAVCQRPPSGHRFHGPVYDRYEVAAAASAAAALG